MTALLSSFLMALTATLVLTPMVLAVASRLGAVDFAGCASRKIHTVAVPRLGGIAVIAAFYLPLIGSLIYRSGFTDRLLETPGLAFGFTLGALTIGGLGVVDDLYGLGAKMKFTVQGVVAIAVVTLGFRAPNPALLDSIYAGEVIGYVVSVLWIVGVTNAFNLLDGLDGLTGGVALCGLAPVLVLTTLHGEPALGMVSFSLAGALIGFLVYNYHPAKIFMGDCGSMFVGFLLALLTVQATSDLSLLDSTLAPLLALALPITDTILAITRRAIACRPLFDGDLDHVHHRLLRTVGGHARAVLFLYGMAAMLALGSLTLSLSGRYSVPIVLASLSLLAMLLRRLGYLGLPGVPAQPGEVPTQIAPQGFSPHSAPGASRLTRSVDLYTKDAPSVSETKYRATLER